MDIRDQIGLLRKEGVTVPIFPPHKKRDGASSLPANDNAGPFERLLQDMWEMERRHAPMLAKLHRKYGGHDADTGN